MRDCILKAKCNTAGEVFWFNETSDGKCDIFRAKNAPAIMQVDKDDVILVEAKYIDRVYDKRYLKNEYFKSLKERRYA